MTFEEKVLQQKLPREKVFRDPVLGYIHINDQIILDLIDTPEFQRLRRVKQLGVSNFTFHGAEHSRFGHSMGVYEIGRRISNSFRRNYPSVEEGDGLWDNKYQLTLLCAGLLHDIGHGAFSHTFEGIFNTNHEEVTQQIITSPDTNINKVLRRLGDDFPKEVASVISKTHPNKQLVQLISSQLDCDRMDYLLRDAYYCGVSYGTFDLTRIQRVIRPYKGKIVFDYSGMHTIEDYIVARHQMYLQVYFHPVSRGMEVVLNRLMQRAKDKFELVKDSSPLLNAFLTGEWTLDDYLALDDHVMTTYFKHWLKLDDKVLVDLAGRFLNRHPFKSVIINEEEKNTVQTALSNELIRLGFNPKYYLLEEGAFNLPYDYYRPQDLKPYTQIELITKRDQIIELSQASAIVRALAGQARGDLRLFFPKEVLTEIENSSNLNNDQQILFAAYQKEADGSTISMIQGGLLDDEGNIKM